MNCDEARAACLAGDDDTDWQGHVRECAACRSHLDRLETGRRLLADPAVWEEPPPELGDQVTSLVTGSRRDQETAHRVRRWMRPISAAAVLVVAVGFYAVLRGPAPDWEVPMPGTDAAPGATSTVAGWNEDSGTRLLVTIDGLDPAPDGYFYEFWLSDGPVHISAGTFTDGGEIDLWTGVRRGDFPRLWVTLEPIDEDESPSPVTVLDTGE